MGQVGGVPFMGLPGNPVAVMVTFLVLARPLILRLQGAREIAPRLYRVAAGFAYTKKASRAEYLRARLERGDDGAWIAHKYPRDGAGILSSMVASDGLVVARLPASPASRLARRSTSCPSAKCWAEPALPLKSVRARG